MIVSIDGKHYKDIDYVQITYGRSIDGRKYDKRNNETIVFSTSLKDKMVFISKGGKE
jgi:hypothetical protein